MSADQSAFKTAVVRDAYNYWLGKKTGDRLPSRRDLSPEEVPQLLPHIFLVDVSLAPVNFRFRLIGSELDRLAKKSYTGLNVDERDYGPNWRVVHDAYLKVVNTRQPAVAEYQAPWVTREFIYYERLIAPLSSDGNNIDMLFGALCPLNRGRVGDGAPAQPAKPPNLGAVLGPSDNPPKKPLSIRAA